MGKWIALGVVLLLVLVLGMCGVGSYNSLVGTSQAVDAQWGQVENVYQRRADLIPNLVNTVKGAANFEQETLIKIAEARASVGKVQIDAKNLPNNPGAFAQFEQAQAGLSSALSRLMVVVERYPELKANANFRDLQAQLEGTENRISVERMRYNEAAQAYNTQRLRFPTVFFANMMGFGEKAYFKAQSGAERAPTVDFGTSPAPAPSPAQ
jgi:LemA protein